MYQFPFIYVYDGDALTDAATYNSIQLPLQKDSDFLLRRVAGVQNVAANWRYYDKINQPRIATNAIALRDYPVVPQLHFPKAGAIQFDLGTILRSNRTYPAVVGSVPNYFSQIAFQGVRLYEEGMSHETPYRYYDYPFTYVQQHTIDYAGRIAATYIAPERARDFALDLQDFDFELQKIQMLIQLFDTATWIPADTHVKMQLQNSSYANMFSAPILDSYINSLTYDYNSDWPIPPLTYPIQGQIRYSIQSLLNQLQVPATLLINFVGVWRRPC